MSTDGMAAIEAAFARWAAAQPDIRGAVVIGSRARTEHPADAWSDLDILVVAADPDRYLDSTGWLSRIGIPWITFIEPTAVGGGRERRVLFAGGYDVDFAIFPAAQFEALLGAPAQGSDPDVAALRATVASVLRRGCRILIDKDGLLEPLATLATGSPNRAPAPSADEVAQAVNDFWYHAVWTARKLARGELWVATRACNGYLTHLIVQMAAWHAAASPEAAVDTWHSGRFFEEWADPRVVAGLRGAVAHYDRADLQRALTGSMDLFTWLAAETADRLGHPYPADIEAHARALVAVALRRP